MKKSVLRMFGAVVLVMSSLGLAGAATVQSAGVTMQFDDHLFTPVLQEGNSFTFGFPVGDVYEPNGNFQLAVSRYAFSFIAQPGYTLTGKMSAQMNISYQLDGLAGSNASASVAFDVLQPLCDFCGPYDATYISTADTSALSDSAPNGSLYLNTGNTPGGGSYDRLIMYMVNVYQLGDAYGQIRFNDITFTAETMPVSAVPELPPVVLLAAGLAVIGVVARYRRRKACSTVDDA